MISIWRVNANRWSCKSQNFRICLFKSFSKQKFDQLYEKSEATLRMQQFSPNCNSEILLSSPKRHNTFTQPPKSMVRKTQSHEQAWRLIRMSPPRNAIIDKQFIDQLSFRHMTPQLLWSSHWLEPAYATNRIWRKSRPRAFEKRQPLSHDTEPRTQNRVSPDFKLDVNKVQLGSELTNIASKRWWKQPAISSMKKKIILLWDLLATQSCFLKYMNRKTLNFEYKHSTCTRS